MGWLGIWGHSARASRHPARLLRASPYNPTVVPSNPGELRSVRAVFDDRTIAVYQAYSPAIAEAALAAGTLVAPFRPDRMTWIKPSFLWMMYRSGWATKPGQERILCLRIAREGFEWALAHGCLSHFEPGTYASREEWLRCLGSSPVRIQWDPDRSLLLEPQPERAIQVGLAGEASRRFVHEWITDLEDVTSLAHDLCDLVGAARIDEARAKLPAERPYPLADQLRAITGAR